jgi:hypothetical protein
MTQASAKRSPQTRHAYKATAATSGHWYGYGYGESPEAAAAAYVSGMPRHERRKRLRDAAICARLDSANGTSWKYPLGPSFEVDVDRTRAAFEAAGAKLAKA